MQIANLTEEQEEKIKQIEEELGYVLVAYKVWRRRQRNMGNGTLVSRCVEVFSLFNTDIKSPIPGISVKNSYSGISKKLVHKKSHCTLICSGFYYSLINTCLRMASKFWLKCLSILLFYISISKANCLNYYFHFHQEVILNIRFLFLVAILTPWIPPCFASLSV